MIRALYFPSNNLLPTDIGVEAYKQVLKKPGGLLWVDFEATAPEDDEPIMRDVFGFHPLAIDDALKETHVPKLDDWSDYLYIVLVATNYDQTNGGELQTVELDVFLGKNYLVTHHDQPIPSVNRTWDLVQVDDRHVKHGPDHVFYRVIDDLVNSYFNVVEMMDDQIDVAEVEIFTKPTPRTLENIFSLKRAVLQLRRIVGPQREVLNRLARDRFPVVDERARVYYRDVYDHLVRLQDITEILRDMISGTLDTYLSVINNRMNDIMKTLTIITTIFMPISFIASFFGMNFFQPVAPLDIWTGTPAFWITMIIIALTPVGMIAWMRRRGWMRMNGSEKG